MVGTAPDSADCFSYWKFDGNANDSSGSNDGTVDGAINSSSYGKINEGYLFDKTNDKITVSHASDISLTGDNWTVVFWMYVNSQAGVQRMINKDDGNDVIGGYSFYTNSGQLINTCSSNGAHNFVTGYSPPIDTWVHIGFTFSKGVERKLYVNGVVQNTSTDYNFNINVETDDDLLFGAILVHSQWYGGWLDEIGMFDATLTSDNMVYLTQGGSPGSEQQYPFSGVSFSGKIIDVDYADLSSYIDVAKANIGEIGGVDVS